MQVTFTLPTIESKRKADPIFEQKKLLEQEFLEMINAQVTKPYKPLTSMQFKIRMNDSGYKTVQSWYILLAEMKQSNNPAKYWGWKTKN